MRGCVNTLSNLLFFSPTISFLFLSFAVCVCEMENEERGDILRESPRAAKRTEDPRLEEDSFKNSMIKGGERVTVWLRIVGHADLSSDQSRLVCRPLSFGGAVLTLSPRGLLLVMGSTRSDRCWISVERETSCCRAVKRGQRSARQRQVIQGNAGAPTPFILQRNE